jgi:hypothetical protein
MDDEKKQDIRDRMDSIGVDITTAFNALQDAARDLLDLKEMLKDL